jgi:hypothetical protein
MEAKLILRLLARATKVLGLDQPLHPWWLGETKPVRAVRRTPVLASPCPSPYDLDPKLLLRAFATEERASIAEQIDASYRELVVLPSRAGEIERKVDEKNVGVQLGLPLIGRKRVLVRICTRNFYGRKELVTGDFHAWLTPDGDEWKGTSAASKNLAAAWPRWIVGRSPGLG